MREDYLNDQFFQHTLDVVVEELFKMLTLTVFINILIQYCKVKIPAIDDQIQYFFV